MFASPENRAKKEAKKSVATQEASAQNQVGKANNKSVEKLNSLQEKSDNLVEKSGLHSLQQKANKNNTGLPDNLKFGIESLSGMSMDDVKVHYNSSSPDKLNASAYAEGSNIYVGKGQEKHIAHEAWHVVQQKQNRVSSNFNHNGVAINNSENLENEATMMGDKAKSLNSSMNSNTPQSLNQTASANTPVPQLMFKGLGKKASDYAESEKEKKDKGLLKTAAGGVLGAAGSAIGGIGGGLFGIGHGIKEKMKGGSFSDTVKNDAMTGYQGGKDTGELMGSGIIDGTKTIAGGALGAATGAVGALGGAAYGAATSEEGILAGASKGFMSGGEAGFNLGNNAAQSAIEIAEEVPGLGVDIARGTLGAGVGAVGALGGAAYGAATSEDGVLAGASQGFMSGGEAGFNLGANSKASEIVTSGVIKQGAKMLDPTGMAKSAAGEGLKKYYESDDVEEKAEDTNETTFGRLKGMALGNDKDGKANNLFDSNTVKGLVTGKGKDGKAKDFTSIDEKNTVQNKISKRGGRVMDILNKRR